MRLLKLLSLVFLVLCAFSCGDDGENTQAAPPAAPLTSAEVLQPGRYGVGSTTMTFEDVSRPTMPNGSYAGAPTRTLVSEIWYPAAAVSPPSVMETRDAPLARGGPFPLIVYSHGFTSHRLGGSFLARQLASYGYVIVSADYPLTNTNAPGGPNVLDLANQPADVSFLIDRMLALSADATSALKGAIDAQRIGLTGLSLGGSTTFLAVFHPTLHDPRVKSAAPIAGGTCNFNQTFFGDRRIPLLILHGDIDAIVAYQQNAVHGFGLANPPKYLVTLLKGSHTAFTDGIEVIAEGANNADDLGCIGLSDLLPTDPEAGQRFIDALGGAAAGVVAGDCPAVCPVRRGPRAMRPSRQHELTILSIVPFFESTLRGDARAKQYLENVLAVENTDATVQVQR